MLIIDENVLFMNSKVPRFSLSEIKRLVICPNLPIAAFELNYFLPIGGLESKIDGELNYVIFES